MHQINPHQAFLQETFGEKSKIAVPIVGPLANQVVQNQLNILEDRGLVKQVGAGANTGYELTKTGQQVAGVVPAVNPI